MNPSELFKTLGGKLSDAEPGNLFGKPCYKIGGKAFCCFFQEEMVFKLKDEAHETALKIQGAKLFDPSGKNRPMKEWVQIPFESSSNWETYLLESANYIRTQL